MWVAVGQQANDHLARHIAMYSLELDVVYPGRSEATRSGA